MGDSKTSLDVFKMWRVNELKEYLKKRGLKTSMKRKEELVALAYGAEHFGVQLIPTKEEETQARISSYQSLYTTEDEGILPDPKTLNLWQNERDAMQKWPPITQIDIAEYILLSDDKDLSKRLLSDYKEGKAYSYFESKWLGEIMYHSITEISKYCYLKSTCRPSQKVTAVPHQLWIMAEKKTGKVRSAYCSCFAGLGSTCNHVAAALFKVEFAFKKGLTASSCTTRECTWNLFGQSTPVQPKRMRDIDLKKPHHSKSLAPKRVTNPPKRQCFDPTEAKGSNSPLGSLDGLVGALYKSNKKAAVFQYVELDHPQRVEYPPEMDLNVGLVTEVESTYAVPPTLMKIAEGCASAKAFLEKLPSLEHGEILALEDSTKDQAESHIWRAQHIGRITSSTIHRVVSFIRNPKVDKSPTKLIESMLIERKELSSVPALKYGRVTEPVARQSYVTYLKETGHKNVKVQNSGLFVCQDRIYIGASPDGLVSCDCCGEGLLEIKCPFKFNDKHPLQAEILYLKDGLEGKQLKRTHPYFSQVMLQLGVVGRRWCDFYVYTSVGHFTERIYFDRTLWNELYDSATKFFEDYMAQHVVDHACATKNPN